MKLNLGCGGDKRPGWINVDKYPEFAPDQVADLEALPWPWPDDSVDEVMLRHVLEHLGRTPELYLGIIKELWRVCRDGAQITIVVPHPRHDSYLNDPTHVRPIMPAGLELFSQAKNREWREKGIANSALGLALGVDFAIDRVDMRPDDLWARRVSSGQITTAQLAEAARQFNNVISEITIRWRAIKKRS
jgi:hypothetical protein